MKKTIAAIMTLALFLICLSATALAASSVYISGDANVRTGPGLDYKSIGVLHRGEDAAYLGETSIDERGVIWYKIRWDGRSAWVSSMYTKKVRY